MKKILLALVLITGFAFYTHAQKGSVLIYGTLAVHNEEEPNNDRRTDFSFNPGVGYQVTEHWTAGVAGGYGHEKFKPVAANKITAKEYRAGGFVRYTRLINSIFSIYGQGDAYYHGQNVSNIKSNGFGFAVIPTIGINVTKRFALNVSFGGISYEINKVKDADEGIETLDFNVGREIRIGVSTNLGGAK